MPTLITDLTLATTIGLSDLLLIRNGGTDKKVTLEMLQGAANGRWYGIVADGVTNDRTALQNALNATAGQIVLILPEGTILCGSAITIPEGAFVIGQGIAKTIIKRNFTGDFITQEGVSVLENLTIEGNTASYGSGKGILIADGVFGVKHDHIAVQNFATSCLEFEADGGSYFEAFACQYITTGSVGTVGAVKINGDDTGAVPRFFYGCSGVGSTLIDFGGGKDIFVLGGFSNGLIYGADSFGVHTTGMRLQNTAITMHGDSHHFVGNIVGVGLTLDTDCVNCVVDASQVADYAVTDNGTGNWVTFPRRTYTPSWTGSGGNPSLGDGTLYGTWSRDGNRVHVDIELTMGSTTTFGSGEWRFSLPVAPYNAAGESMKVGAAFLYDNNVPLINAGIALSNPALSYVKLYANGGAAEITPTTPWTWAQNDIIRFSIDYLVE